MHFSLERRKPPEYVLYTDKVRTGPVPQPVPVQGACFCVQGTYFSVLEYVLFPYFGYIWTCVVYSVFGEVFPMPGCS